MNDTPATTRKTDAQGHPVIPKKDFSILIVDDDAALLKLMHLYLTTNGFERVYLAHSAPEARLVLEKTTPDLTLMDMKLDANPKSGLKLMEEISSQGIPTNFIVVSGADVDVAQLREAMKLGAVDFIQKPFSKDMFCLEIEKALLSTDYRRRARLDSMTHIPNKQTFMSELEKQISMLGRHFEKPAENNAMLLSEASYLSLVMLDIDHFKRFNDTFGHLEGDCALRKVATYFSENIRPSDMFARYGGEEFVLLLPETNFDHAFTVFSRLAFGMSSQQFKIKADQVETITFSAGIATLSYRVLKDRQLLSEIDLRHADGIKRMATHMISAADKGLYLVKQRGRKNCLPFNTLDYYDGQTLLIEK